MGKRKILLFLVFTLISFSSCKDPHKFDSYDDPEKNAKVIVPNPLSVITKLNSNNIFVSVIATVIVSAADASSNSVTPVQYSFKTVQINPDSFGTPGHIQIDNVKVPTNGPLTIQVILESAHCNAFAPDCNSIVGGKQKYIGSITNTSKSSAPTVYQIAKMSYSGSLCCQ